MSNETLYAPVIIHAFRAAGLDAALGLALAKHESNFDPHAVAKNPRDLARGGSYGLFQMSLRTAQGLRASATPQAILDPTYNVSLAVALTLSNLKALRAHNLDTTENLAACHNAGLKNVLARGTVYRRVLEDYVAPVMVLYRAYATELDAASYPAPPNVCEPA